MELVETISFLIVGALTSLAAEYLPAAQRKLERMTPRRRFWLFVALSVVYSGAYAIGLALYTAKPTTWADVMQVIVQAAVAWAGSQGARNVWRTIQTQRVVEYRWPGEGNY